MAIAFDQATSSATLGGASSITYSATVASGSNRVLIVTAGHYDRTRSVSSITFNGVNLSLYLRYENGVNGVTQEIWYLVAPDVTTANVVVTMDATVAPTDLNSAAASFTGVDQTTPIHATHAKSIATGTHTTHSDSLTTSTNNSYAVDCFEGTGSAYSPTADAPTTQATVSNAIGIGYKSVPTAGSTTMSWSFSSFSSATNHIIVELLEAATAATPRHLALLGVGT